MRQGQYQRLSRVTGAALVLSLLLSGCASFPRGAAIETEILKPSRVSGGQEAGFAVTPVERATLQQLAAWPKSGGMGWISRVAQPKNRIIAPGDKIAVTIWNTEENGLLTTTGQRFAQLPEMQVSSSGSVFLPYIGALKISGMAPETARAKIEERYIEATPSAQVQLTLVEGRQNMVSLVSGVSAPGSYPLPDRDYTVMQLLAEGGGVASGLVNPQIRLQRGAKIYGVSVSRLLADPKLDTTLIGGDKVFVESDKRYFLSLGAAGSQKQHFFSQDELTALDAISLIGGVQAARADARGVLILREYPASAVRADGSGPSHSRMIFTLDLTTADGLFSAGKFMIQPDDLIYVTESPINSPRLLMGIIGSVFGLANQASNFAE